MTGLEIAVVLIGIVGGNFGAVIVKPLNLGLFWNSIIGAVGAASLVIAQRVFYVDLFANWSYDILAAAGVGMALPLTLGAVAEFVYRN